VVVRSGYALSPCGDDIVLCGDQSVDICALINSCEPKQPACEGPYDAPPRDCAAGNVDWVLAICYDEKPVRGMTAMLGAGDTVTGARCGCGSGSCGCGGSSATGTCSCGTKAKAAATKPNYKAQCEPTQICEGYRFIVYPAPKQTAINPPVSDRNPDLFYAWLYANRARFGPLIERLLCCMIRAMELRQTIREGKTLDRDFALSAYQDYAAALADFAQDFAIHRCAFVGRAQQLQSTAQAFDWDSQDYANDGARQQALGRNVDALDQVWTELLSECFCSALLPSCPPPATTNCVPLAKITTSRGGPCRVVEICNWSQRKLLINWVTIGYWFSWLPWYRLKEWIAALCCGPKRGEGAVKIMMVMIGLVATSLRSQAAGSSKTVAFMARSSNLGEANVPASDQADAASTANVKAALDSDNLALHLLGQFQKLQTEGAAAAGEPGWTEVMARLANASMTNADTVPDPRMDALFARLDAAEQKIEAQDALIARLSKKG
jgi:hypothetical protein